MQFATAVFNLDPKPSVLGEDSQRQNAHCAPKLANAIQFASNGIPYLLRITDFNLLTLECNFKLDYFWNAFIIVGYVCCDYF